MFNITTTKFSQFTDVGAPAAGDKVAGLRNGVNVLIDLPALPETPFITIALPQQLLISTGYFIANTGPAAFPIPIVSTPGQTFTVINVSGDPITLSQIAGQSMFMGPNQTTVGVAGSLTSNVFGDSITLICLVANTTYLVLNPPQGIWVIA